MAFAAPTGNVYTRDGRMQINRTGQLQTIAGYPVLDAGGLPIIVDPEGGPLTISRDGTITQNNNQVGVLGLFDIPAGARLERFGNSGVIPDRAAAPVIDFMYTGFQQGFVEESNVDALSELTQLITASRALQSVTSLVEGSEGTMQNAIRSLGEPTKT
jgi:flagellar basal-body rod protein FlgF